MFDPIIFTSLFFMICAVYVLQKVSVSIEVKLYYAKCLLQTYFSIFNEVIVRRVWKTTDALRPGDQSISVAWMNNLLHTQKIIDADVHVKSVVIEDLSGNRGLSGTVNQVKVSLATRNGEKKLEKDEMTFLLKMTPGFSKISNRLNTIAAGHPREAIFYDKMRNDLVKTIKIPKSIYTYGSFIDGTFVILLENLQPNITGVNFFFGNQIWGMKDIKYNRDPVDMLSDMFLSAADLHSKYWNDKSLLNKPWLKCVDWYNGKGRSSWLLGVQSALLYWNTTKKMIKNGTSGIKWSSKLISIIDRSFNEASWDNLQKSLHDDSIPFTLVHGDFHASNMLWRHSKDNNGSAVSRTGDLYLVDWSEVAVWEPTTDIGQTMISDVKPEIWRKHGKELVRSYWERLVSNGIDGNKYTFSKCWESYQVGCVERWIWLFAFLSSMGLSPVAVQYFHDQLITFIEDHGDYPSYPLKPIVCFVTKL